ncbi:2-C-methyl-D-erythritol 4-phosphate cytidylyltransferase [Desertivirga arenae]|uniref:2-C-methyl-D-erythritol 4-phosphate cytidylyltransferase n=1 Tax=Desertivirga arenae TaxID=2810309 RepID=UPI001A95C3DD|nr:2-C-methyl-D-erythritol 4-phosphate cytidylyltransferase [Pedobacter sp. SYSU D00823]
MINYAIIVAGGTGSRMKSEIPKQFLPINGLPILMHSITAFYNSMNDVKIILVLHSSYHLYWENLCKEYSFVIPHFIISGGKQRFDSVKNALERITEPGLVAIHDAVRPIITKELIVRCFDTAKEKGSAIPVISSRDSLRVKKGNMTAAIDRDSILIVQTPQVFRSALLKAAYEQPFHSEFTDDASVVEQLGQAVHLVEGDSRNLKITYPEDLDIASVFLNKRA